MQVKIIRKNFLLVLGIDALLLAASWYTAHLVRFDFAIPEVHWISFKKVLPLLLIVKLVCFYMFDLYRGMWRYTSVSDLSNIIKAASVSSLLIISWVLFKTGFIGYPRSVFIIDWCLTIILISGFRLSVRLYFDLLKEEKPRRFAIQMLLKPLRKKHGDRKRLLIIGAGDCGEKIYREIRDNARLPYEVVGFFDDDVSKGGMKIHSIPILGSIRDIEVSAKNLKADEVLIAIPSATSKQMRKIVAHCKESAERKSPGITQKPLRTFR